MALHLHVRVLGWVNRFYLRTTVHNVSFKSEVEGCLSIFKENMPFPSLLGRNEQKRCKAGWWALALLEKVGLAFCLVKKEDQKYKFSILLHAAFFQVEEVDVSDKL